jgi:hypothetical protein
VTSEGEEAFRSLLALLLDCDVSRYGRAAEKQSRGASYRQLAYLGHLARFDVAERSELYRVARCIPLVEAHVSYLIGELKRHREAA